MSFCENLEIEKSDLDNCLYELKLCDHVMECVCCSFFLEKHKHEAVETILNTINTVPRQITQINIPILPVPANKDYYSFNGIETIVYNLFKSENNGFVKSLKDKPVFLKIYYQKHSLLTIPIIQLEIIFFGTLHRNTKNEFWDKLNSQILFFTGSVGDIEVIEINGKEHLKRLLKIPLLFGYPEFKLEGVLLENDFSPSQIKEMNYLHSFTLLPLLMEKVINIKTLELFNYQRHLINKAEIELQSIIDNLSDERVDEIINDMFPDEDIPPKDELWDDIEENLPF